jgi:hypothetical protein
MKKKLIFAFGVLLVAGFAFVGCDNPAGEENDTWTNVTSLNQVNGTWKSFYSRQDMPIKDAMEEQGETWTNEMQTMVGDMKVSVNAEITMTINAATKTLTGRMKIVQTYSGENINTIWTLLSASFQGQDGVAIDNAKHSITINEDIPSQSIDESDIANVQINQNETKLKVPAGTMGENTPEMIYTKQ